MRFIKTALLAFAALTTFNTLGMNTDERTVNLKIVATTDVHGNFFPYDFIARKPWEGSLARVATYVDSLRAKEGDESVILLDNGDILQGQPTVYYYNFIDTVSPHIADEVYRYMRYDAATIGNHDVETGHDVYDRWIKNAGIPVLGANVTDTATGKPYLKPYTIINRKGLKIAVIGMLTPAIPAWLPENLWSGLRFDDMVDTARRIIPEIKEKEQPDLIVGLFHSGADASRKTDGILENASVYVAENVPGLDICIFGHDHKQYCSEVTGPDGHKTLMLNPANNARAVAVADITVSLGPDGKVKSVNTSGHIDDVTGLEPDPAFIDRFMYQYNEVERFVTRRIGTSEGTFSTRQSYFGPSDFMQLLHELQLEISGADISMAAPLSFDTGIAKGPLTVSDMFKLYKYENMLYTMELTGQEIKDYLEFSYSLWADTPDGKDGHLLLFASDHPTPSDNRLKNPSYNFDSAFGIDYTVDISKPAGQRVNITGMSSGAPFSLDRRYKVALNSYRGNGGGNHLTEGAGLSRNEIQKRIVGATDKDLRYYLMKEVEKKGTITPRTDRNWKFIPEDKADRAARADSLLLFGPGASKEQK